MSRASSAYVAAELLVTLLQPEAGEEGGRDGQVTVAPKSTVSQPSVDVHVDEDTNTGDAEFDEQIRRASEDETDCDEDDGDDVDDDDDDKVTAGREEAAPTANWLLFSSSDLLSW